MVFFLSFEFYSVHSVFVCTKCTYVVKGVRYRIVHSICCLICFFYFRSYSFSGCSFCFVICDTKPVECICDMMANRYKSGKSNATLKEKKKSTKQLQSKLLKLLLLLLLLHKIAIGYCPFVVFFFVHISVICIAMHTVTAAAVVFHFLNSCLFLF